jgi:MoaA/NifB/PqqE/SkfB family radical SAM enzyme
MCSIWKIKDHHEAAPALYEKLPKTLRDVNISGGEPFLRKDIAEIVTVIHRHLPRARIVVSSNGLMGEPLVSKALELKEIFPTIGFAFAIDGIGETHDFIRGTEGGFDKVLSVVRELKNAGIKNIRIAYTLTAENAEHMIRVYELARQLGVQFTMQMAHDSEFFFGRHESTIVKNNHAAFGGHTIRDDFEKVIEGELSSYDLKRWVRAYVYYGMYRLLSEGVRPFSSQPGAEFFYLDPKGDIYPSVVHNYVMGNLVENDFDTIWNSRESDEIRKKCQEDQMPYWMGCMLRKALVDHKFQIGLWVLQNKFMGLRL